MIVSGSEVVLAWKGAASVLSLLRTALENWRRNQAVSKYEIQLIRVEAEKGLTVARMQALGDIASASMIQIARITRQLEGLNLGRYERLGNSVLETLADDLNREVERWKLANG
jgi:hypothetical protein